MTRETRAHPVSLLNARVPAALTSGLDLRNLDPATGFALTDFAIDAQGYISPSTDAPTIDMAGRIILPCFIDSHVHLDKAFIVHRTGVPAGGLLDAVRLSIGDAANRTADDLRHRMEKGLELAYAHGASAMRTHLDTPDMPAQSTAWTVFSELRTHWKGRIALQAVALMALDRVEGEDFAERCHQVAHLGGVLGAFVPPGSASASRLDILFAHAAQLGLDVDFHVDESLDATANGLELIAESILRTGFKGRVVAGHCCSLAAKSETSVTGLIAKVAEAGIHVIALPHSNLYLQDRETSRTPRLRGLTLAHELSAGGVSVHFASDNVQDPFFPFGEFDMLEVIRSSVHLAHLDADLERWVPELYRNAAFATRFDTHGSIINGQSADFIAFDATDWFGLLSHAHSNRVVFRNGVPLSPGKPALREMFAMEFS